MMFDNMTLTVNNKKYIVMENVSLDEKQYVYLVNQEDQLDTMFQEINLEGEQTLKPIETEIFVNKIFPLFLEKFKNYE